MLFHWNNFGNGWTALWGQHMQIRIFVLSETYLPPIYTSRDQNCHLLLLLLLGISKMGSIRLIDPCNLSEQVELGWKVQLTNPHVNQMVSWIGLTCALTFFFNLIKVQALKWMIRFGWTPETYDSECVKIKWCIILCYSVFVLISPCYFIMDSFIIHNLRIWLKNILGPFD